jgi:hypothetical protein
MTSTLATRNSTFRALAPLASVACAGLLLVVGCSASQVDDDEASAEGSPLTAGCVQAGYTVGRRDLSCSNVSAARGTWEGTKRHTGTSHGVPVAVCKYLWQPSSSGVRQDVQALRGLADAEFVQEACFDIVPSHLLTPFDFDPNHCTTCGEGVPVCDVCEVQPIDDDIIISLPAGPGTLEEVVLESPSGERTGIVYGAALHGARAVVAKLPPGIKGSDYASARVFVRE